MKGHFITRRWTVRIESYVLVEGADTPDGSDHLRVPVIVGNRTENLDFRPHGALARREWDMENDTGPARSGENTS